MFIIFRLSSVSLLRFIFIFFQPYQNTPMSTNFMILLILHNSHAYRLHFCDLLLPCKFKPSYLPLLFVYTGYFVLISIAFRLLWAAAAGKEALLVHGISKAEIRKITRNENVGLICNAVILATSFLSPWTALVLSFVMWIYWIFFA